MLFHSENTNNRRNIQYKKSAEWAFCGIRDKAKILCGMRDCLYSLAGYGIRTPPPSKAPQSGKGKVIFDNHVFECRQRRKVDKQPLFLVYCFMTLKSSRLLLQVILLLKEVRYNEFFIWTISIDQANSLIWAENALHYRYPSTSNILAHCSSSKL